MFYTGTPAFTVTIDPSSCMGLSFLVSFMLSWEPSVDLYLAAFCLRLLGIVKIFGLNVSHAAANREMIDDDRTRIFITNLM